MIECGELYARKIQIVLAPNDAKLHGKHDIYIFKQVANAQWHCGRGPQITVYQMP